MRTEVSIHSRFRSAVTGLDLLQRNTFILSAAVVLSGICLLPVDAQMDATAPPPAWQPEYWDRMMLSIKGARQRGEMLGAEGLCAPGYPLCSCAGG